MAFWGPMAPGKSTLIGIITGTLAADSGEVLWCGRPAQALPSGASWATCPSSRASTTATPGGGFLAYMAALKEIPRRAVPAEVDRVAAAVNLSDELDKRLSAYSAA